MILRVLLMFLALVPVCSQVQAGWWDNVKSKLGLRERPQPPTIRVLIIHDVSDVNLEVKGVYSLHDPFSQEHISTRFAGKSRRIQAFGDGLRWGEQFPGIFQIQIKPEDLDTVTMINDKLYEGSVYVYDIGGTISIVNQLPIENYIRDILSRPEYNSLHPEVLAALAIVARTNAYFQSANPRNTYWAVDAQKVGFEGIRHNPKPIDDAVEVTRYMIMSRTGIYEGIATPFAAEFGDMKAPKNKDVESSKISLEEAQQLAEKGWHAAQILGKAFPGTTIMLMQYAN